MKSKILAIAVKKYIHLCIGKSSEIDCLAGERIIQSEIAKQLNVHRSVICRQFKPKVRLKIYEDGKIFSHLSKMFQKSIYHH